MSISIVQCPHCQTQNISTAQFCGSCGKSLTFQVGPNGALPQQPQAAIASPNHQPPHSSLSLSGSDAWHEKAGLVCGVLSIFLCGVIAAIPGLYFSWSAMTQAKAQGRSTSLSTIGLAVNGVGILLTCLAIGFMLIMMLMAGMAGGSEMEYGQPGPWGP